MIALQSVHTRSYKFVENVISESDELKLRREMQEVEAMVALDLELSRDIEQFEKLLKKYVSIITNTRFGVKKRGVIDDNDDPIDITLVDKELKKVYISTVRVIINTSAVYNPTTGVNVFVSFSSEGHCIGWNIYVEGDDRLDCTFDESTTHAMLFHKCPSHPWNINDKQIKHREVQRPSRRKVFKPTAYDPSITLPSTKIPKAFRKGSKDYDNQKHKGDQQGGGRRSKYTPHSHRGGSDRRQRSHTPTKERNGTPKSSRQDE